MDEIQVRELLGKSLPKLAVVAINSIYRLNFQAAQGRSRDFSVESQIVGSQLVYSRNFQIHGLLTLESGMIFPLGQRAFPKYARAECPKIVLAAIGEALNTIMGKLAYFIGKVDGEVEVLTAPQMLLNCSGSNGIPVRGEDSLFLNLTERDISMELITSVQRV